MTLYRVVDQIMFGNEIIPAGTISDLRWIKARGTLEKAGVIAPVSTPPLRVLPGWGARAGALARVGIETVEQFLEARPEALSKELGASESSIRKHQREVMRWLILESE